MEIRAQFRYVFLTFLECEFRGGWKDMQDETRLAISFGSETYFKVWQEPAEVWLVRADGLKRAFSFRNESIVVRYSGMIGFNQKDIIEELPVDEDEQAGRTPKSKLRSYLMK